MKNLSDIELSSKLTKLSRKIKTLTSLIPSNPSSPADFVNKAGIEAEVAELQANQTDIGKELLARDKAAAARNLKRVDAAVTQGKADAKLLLEKLSVFAEKLSLSTNGLATEYAEILELSLKTRRVNGLMLHSNRPHITSLYLEPNNIHRVVKTQLVKSLGANTLNVFLPQNGAEILDIVDVVEGVVSHES